MHGVRRLRLLRRVPRFPGLITLRVHELALVHAGGLLSLMYRKEFTMVKVSMPRGNWDQIELILEDMQAQGYLVEGLLKEIQQQTHAQEG